MLYLNKTGPKPRDLTGERFGRWTVLGFAFRNGPEYHWFCKCDCGIERTVLGANLRKRGSRSCGCLKEEVNAARLTKHGLARTKEYHAYQGMIQRCYNSKASYYHRYGARGIRVCKRWLESFENFYADIGLSPSPEHSVERKNRDGPYCPENCCWATDKEQSRNTCRNRMLTHNAQTRSVAEWAELSGISQSAISNRLADGWSLHDALTIPAIRGHKPHGRRRKSS